MDSVKQLLYLMPDPHSQSWVKVGKTKLPTFQMRIGNYQQGNGPNYTVTWPYCWIGDLKVIDKLELEIKKLFDRNRPLRGRGYTEWVEGYSIVTIRPVIQDIIDGYGYLALPVDDDLLPITVDNVDDVQRRYKNAKKI